MNRILFLILCTTALFAVESYPTYPPIAAGSAAYRESFSDVLASSWGTEWMRIQLGTGMTMSQGSGNGVINSGTTANAETVMRLPRQLTGPFSLRGKVTLSQRIANNNFFIELVDMIGDGLECTINSAISITVKLPVGYPNMSAMDVGKSFTVGVISGAAGIPGRFPVASVDTTGRFVNLTVAGWPASGSCTVSAWGLNSYRNLYTSTTATNVTFDIQREGWASGDSTLTINTTASGHVFSINSEDVSATYMDAASNVLTWVQRGQRTENIPSPDVPLVLQVRALNGTTNPASTTAFTIGFLTLERFASQEVTIVSSKALGGLDGVPTVNIGTNSATNQSMNIAQIAGGAPDMNSGAASANTLRVVTANNSSVNVAQMAGTAVTMNSGNATAGTPRMTLASDQVWIAATSFVKAEDAVAASGDGGANILGVRRDAATVSAGAAADYSELTNNRFGALYTAGFRTHTRTYSATHNITAAASATDIAWLPGNGTSTVHVTKVRVSGIQTTTGTPEVLLIMRSTANSGGTSTSFSVGRHEIADSANNSTPIGYTVNPTPGTSAGTIRRQYLPVSAAASGLSSELVFELSDNGKPIVLSGTAQGLAINLNGTTVTGGIFNMTIEWIEF